MSDELKRAFGLEGERALITGGGTGLGFAMAKCFVQAGADVVITGRREDMLKEAVKQLGPKADYRVFDVTDTANAVPFVEMLTQEIGPVICRQGSFTFILNQKTFSAKAGDTLFLPKPLPYCC